MPLNQITGIQCASISSHLTLQPIGLVRGTEISFFERCSSRILLTIAHTINQLILKGSLIRSLMKTFGSGKNFARRLADYALTSNPAAH
jgi:hypothetical protein